jgi:uncharacterized damage-inducible protein DinB
MPTKKSKSPKAKNPQLHALVLGQWNREVVDIYLMRLSESLKLLSDEEIWWRPNPASNSMGNIVLHLCGNVRQWITSGLGGADDIRQRDLEFSEKGPIPRDELLKRRNATVNEAGKAIAKLSADDLMRTYSIQGFTAKGGDVLTRIIAHFGYHAGQVVYFAKMQRAKDLGFTKLPPLSKKKSPSAAGKKRD